MYSKEKYEELISGCGEDIKQEGFPYDELYDIAGSLLETEEGLAEYMRLKMGVHDKVGRLVADIWEKAR